MKIKKYKDPLKHLYEIYPIAFLDYLWVITIYISITIFLAILIDGYILPPFDKDKAKESSTPVLFIKVLLQLAFQGFIVICLSLILIKIPSPVNGLLGYDKNSDLGTIIRNPTIIFIILFHLSKSLQGRLITLFSRFNENAHKPLIDLK